MQWFSLSTTLFSPLHYARQVHTKALFDVICIICFKWPNFTTGIHFLYSKMNGNNKRIRIFLCTFFFVFPNSCSDDVCFFISVAIMMGMYGECWMGKQVNRKFQQNRIVRNVIFRNNFFFWRHINQNLIEFKWMNIFFGKEVTLILKLCQKFTLFDRGHSSHKIECRMVLRIRLKVISLRKQW